MKIRIHAISMACAKDDVTRSYGAGKHSMNKPKITGATGTVIAMAIGITA
jgi:hypothetical protein